MAHLTSPLRYPGGKARLFKAISTILRINGLERKPYVEPFAGGCGLALTLLCQGCVRDIHINDVDLSIWAFWHSVLNQTDELADMVMKIPVTIDEWHRQRDIHLRQDSRNSLALGFSTFFLNRTNRSGIIKAAGVIGGLSQNGPYKLDCRFNRGDLVRRIRRVAKYRNRIHLWQLDALEFLSECRKRLPLSAFFCIDPPYFNKGSSFYMPLDHDVKAGYRRSYTEGEEKPLLILRGTFANEGRAKAAAKGRLRVIQAAAATLRLVMPGDPSIRAGHRLQLTGELPPFLLRPLWIATQVQHEIAASGGYKTTVECEIFPDRKKDGMPGR